MKARDVIEFETGSLHPSHAYLFVSDDDSELDQLIANFAKLWSLRPSDIFFVNSEKKAGKAGEIRKESVEELLHNLNLSSYDAGRLGVIRNCDKLNNASANILLKTLEEPPLGVRFILTSGSERVLPTIRSRCRTYRLTTGYLGENHTLSYSQIRTKPLCDLFRQVEEIVKNGEENQLLLSLENELRQEMIKSIGSKADQKIDLICQTMKRIAGNANSRLAIDNLVISLK